MGALKTSCLEGVLGRLRVILEMAWDVVLIFQADLSCLGAPRRRLGASWQSFFGPRKRLGSDVTCTVHFESVRSTETDSY